MNARSNTRKRKRQNVGRAWAERRWPWAEWIAGEGYYASLAHCRADLTVMLAATRTEAEVLKAEIDKTACGGGCRRFHEIVRRWQRQTPLEKIFEVNPWRRKRHVHK